MHVVPERLAVLALAAQQQVGGAALDQRALQPLDLVLRRAAALQEAQRLADHLLGLVAGDAPERRIDIEDGGFRRGRVAQGDADGDGLQGGGQHRVARDDGAGVGGAVRHRDERRRAEDRGIDQQAIGGAGRVVQRDAGEAMGQAAAVGGPGQLVRRQGRDRGDRRNGAAAALRPGIEQGLRRDAGPQHVVERDAACAELVAEGAAGAEQAVLRIEAGDRERQRLPGIGRGRGRARRVGARDGRALPRPQRPRAVQRKRCEQDDRDRARGCRIPCVSPKKPKRGLQRSP